MLRRTDPAVPASSATPPLRPIDAILELARWAPSGDNTQPWRFEVVDDRNVIVHGFDTRSHCVYDLDGHPSQMAMGAMLETAALAASAQGLRMEATRQADSPETAPRFALRFVPDASVVASPMVASITVRSVQRRPMSMRRLDADQKAALAAAAGPGYRVIWIDGVRGKLETARLLFDNAKLRLTLPEAYATHRDVIEWNARYSDDRVPDQALGVDRMTARMMRWGLKSWGRVEFFNRYLAGTWIPRLQMDLLPAVACAAHFLIVAATPPRTIDDYVAAGRAVQRVWLTATGLALGMQPEMTPLIFARYVRERRAFSALPEMGEHAAALAEAFATLAGPETAAAAVFMGRIGAGKSARSRSLRRAVADLAIGTPRG